MFREEKFGIDPRRDEPLKKIIALYSSGIYCHLPYPYETKRESE